MWDHEEPIRHHPALQGIEVPPWIDQDISPFDVASIVEGGCDSGAYMPAVTYAEALHTMNEHGDEIFDYLAGARDSLETIVLDATCESWTGWACALVSAAVEQWARDVEVEISDALGEPSNQVEGSTPPSKGKDKGLVR